MNGDVGRGRIRRFRQHRARDRSLVVAPRTATLDAARLPAGLKLAPEAALVPRFGYEKGALGPVGAHGGATVLVDEALRGTVIAVGCGDPAKALAVDADALVARLRDDRAVARAAFARVTRGGPS